MAQPYQDPPEEECICGVCYMLLLEPTTLNCGHTVCRGCLAGWYLSTRPRKETCPMCRQLWEGKPQVNRVLRSVIERMFPQQILERQQEMEGNDGYKYKSKLKEFEKELSSRKPSGTSRGPGPIPANQHRFQRNLGMVGGVAVACLAVLVMSLLLSWVRSSGKGKEKVDTIPVAIWEAQDVAQWLVSLGWARHYSEFAYQYQVDGRALLNLETEKLSDLLNVTDLHHRNAFELAVVYLRECGVRMPQTVWEYKALFPERAMYLSQWMKDTPRCTTLILYLFFYEDTYLPFLHSTVPRQSEDEFNMNNRLPAPTWTQSVMFFLMMLLFPYEMVGLFAWSVRSSHTLTHLVVILSCFFHTILELSFLSSCLRPRQWRLWKEYAQSHAKKVMLLFAYSCGYQLLPYFMMSLLFYYNVYIAPVALFKTFREIIRH